MRKFLSVLLLLLLGACTPFDYAPPPATPEAITVAYPPTLGWIETALHDCAEQTPGMILLVEERVSPDLQGAEVFLSPGPPSEGIPGYATLLGQESLVVIANPAIDPTTIDIATIRNSYTSLEPPYQAWTYPQGYSLRQIFKDALLEADYAPGVLVAPDPDAMVEAVATQESAIGFLLEADLVGSVEVIPMSEEVEEMLEVAIIALTANQPEGVLRNFLGCLGEDETIQAAY
jgi:hypothetical protein